MIAGPMGAIETLIDAPSNPRGIALLAHPHPLGGGTNTNKVMHTLARTFAHLGYVTLRPNFRGVGRSEGEHDQGEGESADLLTVLAEAKRIYRAEAMLPEPPVVLAGFSFGAYCQTRVARQLSKMGQPAQRLVLVGTAAGRIFEGDRHYNTEAVPADSIIIHGSEDKIVPLDNVLAWARPLDLPVVVVPGADHFFHRRLHILRELVCRAWYGTETAN